MLDQLKILLDLGPTDIHGQAYLISAEGKEGEIERHLAQN
jgi:hypothetical protein